MTKPHTSNNKREELRRLQAQQVKEARLRRIISFALLGVIILAVSVSSIFLVKNAQEGKTSLPAATQLTPKYLTTDGSFRIGPLGVLDVKADATAKVGATRVEIFFDPMCPGCGALERTLGEVLLSLVNDGVIDLYMVPTSFLDRASTDQYSTRAVNALITVANESPEHMMGFIQAIYTTGIQPEEGNAYKSVTDDKLVSIAKAVGVPEEKALMIKNRSYVDWIATHTTKSIARKDLFPKGDFSTPAVFVGGSVNAAGEVTGAERVQFNAQTSITDSFSQALQKARAAK